MCVTLAKLVMRCPFGFNKSKINHVFPWIFSDNNPNYLNLRSLWCSLHLTHLSLASFLWDIGKQHSPRCDAAERGVPSGVILFAQRNFIKNEINN